MSSSRWIALHCGDDSETLIEKWPNAFLLLTQIATRAKWKDCPISGLKFGQSYIGDWKKAGIATEGAYRQAKKILEKCELATFHGTNKGTIATLLNRTIYSIKPPSSNEQHNGQAANQQQTDNRQGTTNHTDIQIDGNTETRPTDSNSAPVGTASMCDSQLITWENAEKITRGLYEQSKCDPDSPLAFFEWPEISSWAKDWHLKYKGTGGMLNASRIVNPAAALEAYLRQCAQNQSKRLKELRHAPSAEEDEPPF